MHDGTVAPQSALEMHYIVEFFGGQNLMDTAPVQTGLHEGAERAGAVESIHNFGEGQEVSDVVILTEPHAPIHTWPEHNGAAIDIFMCGGSVSLERSLDRSRAFFKPESESISQLQCGP